MSLTQSDYSPPSQPGPMGAGQGLRLEDILRLVVLGIVVLIGGLTLGNITFHELQARGTGYFILAGSLAIILTAIAYYRFQPTVALFTAVLWISIGGTPDLATGVSSGTGKSLYPVELGALFLLFIWVVRGVSLGKFRVVRTPMNKWLIVYLAFCFWTAINGWLFWDPALTHFYAGLPGNGKTAPQVVVLGTHAAGPIHRHVLAGGQHRHRSEMAAADQFPVPAAGPRCLFGPLARGSRIFGGLRHFA